jgi:hypothetical protein
MQTQVNWHGTRKEYITLLRLVDRLCADGRHDGEHCTYGPLDRPVSTCAAHAMLGEQRVLDGLLWMRRFAARLVRAERELAGQPL